MSKDRDLTPPAQAPAPSWSQASNRCYLCFTETALTCQLCVKAVCELHAIQSGQVMCSTCDENELKEEIRAEMQEELVALGRDLETAKGKLEEVERQGEEMDKEIEQLHAESAKTLADEKTLEAELLAQIQAEEAALQQLQQALSTLHTTQQTLEDEDRQLAQDYAEADEDLNRVTTERYNLQMRRKDMAANLERVNKQLQNTFLPSQLESIACEQCKRKLAASYQSREPPHR